MNIVKYFSVVMIMAYYCLMPLASFAESQAVYNAINAPLYGGSCNSAAGGGAPGTAAPGNNNATIAYAYLIGVGMSAAGAAGIVGNMIEESGVGPERLQSTPGSQVTTAAQMVSTGQVDAAGVGWGIVQWTPASQIITTSSPSATVNTLYYQLGFFWNELGKSYSSVETTLKADTSPTQAATDFLNGFEKGDASPQREENAQAIYDFEKNGTALPESVLGDIVSGAAANPGVAGDAQATAAAAGSCSGSGTAVGGNCANPLRDVKGLTPERVDQGVDYMGNGPIYPVCSGTLVEVLTTGSGWPGLGTGEDGAFIVYHLTSGAASGKNVYFAEDCKPIVTNGQKGMALTVNTPICNMYEGGTNIETGWANAAGDTAESQMPEAGSIDGASSCIEVSIPTLIGLNFNKLLMSLGAPSGTTQPGTCGELPAGWPTWP